MGAAVGLLAGICLIAGVEGRAWRFLPRATVQSLFQLHDVLIIGQALLFIPFAAAFGRAAGMTASAVGVVSLLAMAILQTLRVFGIGPDTLYMLPQGVLGLWVIWMAIATRTQHARGTVGLGVASGIGLVLVGASADDVGVLRSGVVLGCGSERGCDRSPDQSLESLHAACGDISRTPRVSAVGVAGDERQYGLGVMRRLEGLIHSV
jgi:hypothetical protein